MWQVAVLAIAVTAAVPAAAGMPAVVGDPIVSGSLTVNGVTQNLEMPGTIYAANNTAQLGATLSPQPTLTIYSDGAAYGGLNLTYDYAVLVALGGVTPDRIDGLITADGDYSLHVNGGYAAVQADTITANQSGPTGFFRQSSYFGITGGQFSIPGGGSFAGTTTDGNGDTLAIYAGKLHLGAGLTTPGVEAGQAFIDPVITINLAALQLAGFTGTPTLLFSPGVGNGAPVGGVPDAATWTLLIAGFGAVGVAARRRRALRVA